MDNVSLKEYIKTKYAEVSSGTKKACCGNKSMVYYGENELKAVSKDMYMGVSCGNPTAIAGLKEGEVVLDLGSGGGLDCFLAAQRVKDKGHVIGVDMTTAMIEKARKNLEELGLKNVEFRLGEIETLPVDNESIDVVISNCVINLSQDKPKVFKEIYRVLKKKGKACISDIVLAGSLPEDIQRSMEAWANCISGALLKDTYLGLAKKAGFEGIRIEKEVPFAKEDLDEQIKDKALSLSYVLYKDI